MNSDRFEGNKRELPTTPGDEQPSAEQLHRFENSDDDVSAVLNTLAADGPLGTIDSLVWQRLVDDRLDDEQYRELLVTMESRPSLWRDCALAFLEEQAIRKSLVELRRGLGSAPPKTSQRQTAAPKLTTPVASTAEVMTQQSSAINSRNRKVGVWKIAVPALAAAAGFVLTLYSFSENGRNSAIDNSGAGADSGVNSTPVATERAEFRDYLAELSADQRRELFELSSLKTEGMPIEAEPILMSPSRVDGKRRFLFYRTIDGGHIIVPVDDYQYVTHDFQ
ncbi:MAG: hypothetical protein JNL67_00885 [Planctomycetaceae bacterium]|nr:hypothetical protein [Planctomycetaceae bacterium]